MKKLIKSTWSLMLRSALVLFLYRLICSLVKEYLLSPAAGFLWGLALKTTPSSYISSSNIFDLLKNPLCILVGLIIVFAYAFVTVWEVFGIITGLEYAYEERNIGILNLFRANFFQTKHMFKPKNWPFVFLIAALLPILGILNNEGKLAGFAIPEYIMLVISNNPFLMILYVLVIVALIILVLRMMYGFYTFVTEKKDAKESMKTGFRLIRHHNIRAIVTLIVAELVSLLLFGTIPGLLVSGVESLLGLFFKDSFAYAAAADLCFGQMLLPILKFVSGFVCMLSILSVNLNLYHRFMADAGVEETLMDERFSSEMGVARKKNLKVFPIVLGSLLLVTIVLTSVCTYGLANNKDAAGDLIEQFKIDVIAHRGYAEIAPENTIPAFRLAAQSENCDMAELDVTPSKEGIPIVMHDLTAKRTTGKNAKIRDLTLEEIKQLDAGSFFDEKYKGTEVPTLEEVLQFAKSEGLMLLIEIKNTKDCPEFEKTVVDLIHKYDFTEMCCIHSLSYESLVRVKECDPSIPCGYIMAIASGAFMDLPAADFFCIEHTFINDTLVNRAKQRGKKIYAWTMNDDKFIREMADLGVAGMIGDNPDNIYEVSTEQFKGVENYVMNSFNSIPLDFEDETPVQSTEELLEGA